MIQPENKPKNYYDDLAASVKYQTMQLSAIRNYMYDYIEILKNV